MKLQFVMFSVCLLASVPVWAKTQTGTTGITSKTISLPGDWQLEYVEQGNPKGMPLILLLGYTDSWLSAHRPALHWEKPQQFALDLIAFSRIVKNYK